MSLPPELRNRIYLEILPTNQYYGTAPYCTRTKLPLLQVSKQIRAETACIFYGNNRFGIQFRLDSVDFATGIQQCRSIVKTCGPRPFLELRLSQLGTNTKILPHIAKLLPLLELMRDLKFEPDRNFVPGDHTNREDKARSIANGRSLFQNVLYSAVHDALGRAMALGRRARDEEWTQAQLEQRFAEFVKFALKGPKKHIPPKRPPKWPATF